MTTTHANLAAPTRDGAGRFARDAATALRDAQAVQLRLDGLTYRQIAVRLGVDVSTAHTAVQRALEETLAEPASELRQLELDRLDALHAEAWAVMQRDHVIVSNGRVVEYNGQPVPDYGPVLTAIDKLVRISESRRKLLGLDAAQRVDVDAGITYQIVGVDPSDLI